MPYKTTKLKGGRVRVTSPHGTKAKSATPANAKRQVRLLNAIEHNPNFRPTGKSAAPKHQASMAKRVMGKY